LVMKQLRAVLGLWLLENKPPTNSLLNLSGKSIWPINLANPVSHVPIIRA
jgi:hypothetical protein